LGVLLIAAPLFIRKFSNCMHPPHNQKIKPTRHGQA